MSDEEAEALGELVWAECIQAGRQNVDFVSLGRIAVKLAEPYVLENNRDPSEAMLKGFGIHRFRMRDNWQAMIDARLAELKQ